MVAECSARAERTRTINHGRALILTGPENLRFRFAQHSAAALVAEIALLRPPPGDAAGYATRFAFRELGWRSEFLDDQIERLDELIVPLVTSRAPGMLALYGIGSETAALLLVAAGDTPNGSAPRPGPTCAPSSRSPFPPASAHATGSTAAVTARPITHCGGSRSRG